MNRPLLGVGSRWGRVSFLLLFCSFVLAAPLEQPRIESIHIDGDDVVVVAAVPAGIRKITLESRPRLGPGGWEPRQVARLSGEEGEIKVTFRLRTSDQLEMLRVRADETEPLPAWFYVGSSGAEVQPLGSGGAVDIAYGVPGSRDDAAPEESAGREVVESDIWQLRGDTLYFFNQYRGLQVIDLKEPDAPQLSGTLALPSAGEQMYALDSGELVLLTRGGCYYQTTESEVLILTVTDGQPEIVQRLPVAGQIQESRLVGTALYIAAQTYQAVAGSDGTAWEWGTRVSAFDLSVPLAPVTRNTLWFPGYNQVVAATERFFFVTTQDGSDWRRSVVNLVDIGDPSGELVPLGSVRPAGQVKDKFKIHVNGEVLTVISEVRETTLFTVLETFSVADAAAPAKLGELTLGLSERLHATRFEGDRVYVVTFFVEFQMDPLWVVDLSKPEQPTIVGELEIPGWSTYLHPWGDRLVACGIETNRTTVSLFDVSDPAEPALLERVAIGSGWSWSEANNDEKAFKVLPDANLVLLPYQSWDTGEATMRVQLVDLFEDTLVARGAIDHGMTPRRATLHQDRVISVSGRELLCADIADRDQPRVTARLDLAWPVDWLFVQGDYLLELSRGPLWYGETGAPTLRLASAAEPDTVIESIAMSREWPILSADVNEGRLFVVQGTQGVSPPPEGEESPPAGTESEPTLSVTVYDLGNLPSIPEPGRTEWTVADLGWGSEFQMLWPRTDLLVLAGGGGYWYPWLDVGVRPAEDVAGVGVWAPFYWGGTGGRFLAFDLTVAEAPQLTSEINLTTNGWWNFSGAWVADGMVYVTHQVAEPAPPQIDYDASTGEWRTNQPPEWLWVQRSYLDVIDYSNSTDPLVRRPLETPGVLSGISHDGAMVYTAGARWQPDADWSNDSTEWLDASAYDGVALHLVDSLELPNYWPRPLTMVDDVALLGRADPAGSGSGHLETWVLAEHGAFVPVSRLKLASAAQSLVMVDGLLAAQVSHGVVVFDLAEPAHPVQRASATPPGCVWPDLRHAAADLPRGIWMPLGLNGVWWLPIGSGL